MAWPFAATEDREKSIAGYFLCSLTGSFDRGEWEGAGDTGGFTSALHLAFNPVTLPFEQREEMIAFHLVFSAIASF